MTGQCNNAISTLMAEWIMKVQHNLTSFRVTIPKVVVNKMGWEDVRYVVVEDRWDDKLLIRRLPGEEKRNNEGTKYPVVGD